MYNQIFSPVFIGKLSVKNRLVVPPMVANMFSPAGEVTEQYIAYIAERAKGGFGLIITENLGISPGARAFPLNGGIWSEAQCTGLASLTAKVHEAGGKIAAQLYHAGRETCSVITGEIPVAPSALRDPTVHETPIELSQEEISGIVRDFGKAALRSKNAGFDAVEIHCAHGYLLNEFLSPFSNKRTDEYGGSMLNRARIIKEVIEEIRRTAGGDYPLMARISVDELVCGGLTVEDMKANARLFEEWGLDAIDVSFGVFASGGKIARSNYGPHAQMTEFAAEIKKTVGIPVIAVGRINDPIIAESVIASGQADLVAIGRGSIADPHLPEKAQSGRADEIAFCMGCRQLCNENLFAGKPIGCLMNPESCNEYLPSLEKTIKPKYVLVVGGGLAGMQAAATAARRGHKVKILEKSGKLGGQWLLAMIPPHKQEFGNLIIFLKKQLSLLGVEVSLNAQADADIIALEHADAVILATGANAKDPQVEIFWEDGVLTEWDVLGLRAETGERVAVLNLGVTCGETASFLAAQGKKITLLERGQVAARYSDETVRASLLEDLAAQGVETIVQAKTVRIEKNAVVYEKEGLEQRLEGLDSVVVCTGSKSVLPSMPEGTSYTIIGDARMPGGAKKAILEGYHAGAGI